MELRGVLEIRDLQGHRSADIPRVLQPQRLQGSRSGTAAPPLRSGYALALRAYRPAGDAATAATTKDERKNPRPTPAAGTRKTENEGEKS